VGKTQQPEQGTMTTATPKPKLIPFHRLANRLPGRKEGAHLHPATLYRWHKDGVLAADGERIRLEAQRVGGHWCTSMRKLRRFFNRLGEGCSPETAMPATRKEHERARSEAERALDRLGIGERS
jgi:hypothetical protein